MAYRRQSVFARLLANWRVPLTAILALLMAGMAVWPRSLDTSTSDSTAAVLAPRPAGVAVPTVIAAPPAQSVASTPAAQPTAMPSTVRPLAVPTRPPANATGRAPLRKAGTPDPDPSTDHVVVMDGDSGAILFQRNAYEAIAPASLTKIMTAILGIEHGVLSEHVKVDVDARSLSDSTVMGLEPWFDITLEDLLYGLMLPSGNDAALAIARYVARSDGAFVKLMNEKAAWLGLRCTYFVNPHGLDEPNHYSCPADMATMARYAMQYEEFRKLAATRSYGIKGSNVSYTVENLNPMLWAYPGADGVKVGYTDNAGRSIVASAVKNGHRVYVAFMRSTAGLAPDATLLLDWAFSSFTWP